MNAARIRSAVSRVRTALEHSTRSIGPSAWREVFCAGFDAEKTARHLKSEGLLLADDAGGKLQRQEKVLRGDAVAKARFYVLDIEILRDGVETGPKDAV